MWRSLLFVPVVEERFVAKAAARGADAVVLDLEASIAPDRKVEARAALPGAIDRLAPHIPVTVRINPVWMQTVRDLEACVRPGVAALHLALCESADELRAVDGLIRDLEAERNMSPGAIKLVAMLESAAAVTRAVEIARASSRLVALTLGVEDYATSMGVAASPEVLRPAAAQVIQAARAAGIEAWVVPASMADYRDIAALEEAARYARALGATGGYVVHPAQIATLHTVFAATEDEIRWSERIVAAARDAERAGKGAFAVDGQMIDAPLITRAERILARSLDTT